MDNIVVSFVNISFEIGEQLIKNRLLTSDDIDAMETKILIGLPSLSVLHCIEKTTNFNDGYTHFATGTTIHPINNNFPQIIKDLLKSIMDGVKIYNKINFTNESYDGFKTNIIISYDTDADVIFDDDQKNLRDVIVGVAWKISQIDAYKTNYTNVLNVLRTMC